MNINPHTRIIIQKLAQMYPNAKIVLSYHTPWELLVSVILSAQCTDVMVNKVTALLFKKYRSLDDYVSADSNVFEQDIKPTGFFRNKAKNIHACAKIIKETYRDRIPDTMDELTKLPGVARKTANIILGNVYGRVEGIAVDTHVHRISQRLRLIDLKRIGGKKNITFEKNGKEIVDYIKDANPEKIERELMNTIPRDTWFHFTYRIIDHGRSLCKAQKPNCSGCPLASYCPTSRI
jgi:endonuclease-3